MSKDFVPKTNKCYYTLSTQEGPKAWKEAVSVLSSVKETLKPLQWSEGLSQACYDHIRDQGPQGQSGHTGSDGSSPFDRIDKYVKSTMSGENLAYSDAETGTDMVLQLLIDDGVPNRGHRTNMLSNDFTHVGISCGCHAYYTEMCCFAYGKDVSENDRSLVANVAPQLKKCKEYKPSTRGDTTENFKVGEVPALKTSPPKPAPTRPEGAPISPQKINNFDDLFPGLYNNNFRGTADRETRGGFGNHDNVGPSQYNNDWGIGPSTWNFDNWFDNSWEYSKFG